MAFEVNNNINDITRGITTDVMKMVVNAIESNSTESFAEIDNFVSQIIDLSISNKYLTHFKEYLNVAIIYYVQGFEYNKRNSAIYKRMYDDCSQKAVERISDYFLFLDALYDKSNIEDKIEYNKLKYVSFATISQLLFEQVGRKDFPKFKKTIEQLENGILFHNVNMNVVMSNYSQFEKSTQEKKDNYIQDIQSIFYYKQTLLGIKYWLYFLYGNNQILKEEFDAFVKRINKTTRTNIKETYFWEIELLFNRLNTGKSLWYMNWGSWDYETHPDGKFYTMKSPLNWIFEGYIIDSIIAKGLKFPFMQNFNLAQFEEQNPQNRKFLIHTLKEKIDKIEKNQKWKEYFNNNIDTQQIKNQLNQIENQINNQNAVNIANATLDINQINNFKMYVYNAWKDYSTIQKCFKHFKILKKQTKTAQAEKELPKIGQQNWYCKDLKSLFIENEKSNLVAGLSHLGTLMSDWEEDAFMKTIFQYRTETVYPSLFEGLDESLKKLKPTVIFMDNNFLLNNLERSPNWDFNMKEKEIFDGFYNKIPVIFLRSLEGRYIAANFKKSFKLTYSTYKNGFGDNKEMNIEVKEITEDIARNKFNATDETIVQIKNGVLLNLEISEILEILDDTAFEIGLINK